MDFPNLPKGVGIGSRKQAERPIGPPGVLAPVIVADYFGFLTFLELTMLRFIMSLSRDERGVSALEYAILAAIIVSALVAVGTVMTGADSSSGLQGLFNSLLTTIKGKLPS
jgi:pilus assembly protein Flp/PilA